MSEWFCVVDGRQSGPHDERHLRQMAADGRLGPQDLAWREGMDQWAAAGSISGLLPPAAGAPAGAVPRLAYATPAHLAPPPPTAVPVVAPDDGPFLRIGGSFSTGKSRWNGPVVASPRAFYLLKVTQHQQGGHYGGGLVGAMIAAAVTGPDDTRSCSAADLPVPVRMQLDPKGKYTTKDVIVLPKEAIRRVKVPAVNNAVYVHSGSDRFALFMMLFRNGTVRRFLADNGWTLNADVQPTAAPVHGIGFGRTPDAPPKGRSMLTRVLLVLLAVLIVVAVIALRVAAER